MLPNNISHQIRSKRRLLNLTIEELAEKSDTSVALISRIERNVVDSVSLSKLIAVIDALAIPMSDIFGVPNVDNQTNELWGYLMSLSASERQEKASAILKLVK
ncbi:helix-turn-helix domain-containing protein [Latilactobacillus fragifolii]|uniref:helix-turn-helix domain-containing protein n=1 Tax=Latilactobacillus fragifolii TaxID=2814244 RepID=UPI001ABB2069|nr:helix-turn-helix transcriptional regulator [Latilactobacillus fragifolii]